MRSGTTSLQKYLDAHPQIALHENKSSTHYTKLPVYRDVVGARLLNGISLCVPAWLKNGAVDKRRSQQDILQSFPNTRLMPSSR